MGAAMASDPHDAEMRRLEAAIRERISYDPDSGVLTRISTGKAISCVGHCGYIQVRIWPKRFFAHRVAWFLHFGQWPSGLIDHINGDPLDNRIANLRVVDSRTNNQNLRRARKNNQSGLLGARLRKRGGAKPYFAAITHEGNWIYLGAFATAQEAHEAYLVAKRRLHEGCTI